MSKKHKKFRKLSLALSYRTKVVIAITAGLIVVGILVVVLIGLNQGNTGDLDITADQKAKREANVKRSQRDSAVLDEATDAIEEGNAEKANEVYEAAIESEEDTARKVKLAIDQSRLFYYAGKVDEAIRVAKEAENLGDDKFLIAFWLARVYEDQKQYKLAADYYVLAGKWATSDTNKTKLKKEYFDTQASRTSTLAGGRL